LVHRPHVLELAGLLRMDILAGARQDGRFIYDSANFAAMNRLLGYLTENCCARDGVGCETDCCEGKPAKARA
jgi:hypothetical protein